jgi:hypothetical protein
MRATRIAGHQVSTVGGFGQISVDHGLVEVGESSPDLRRLPLFEQQP